MQKWHDDLENRLKGREIPLKYWEYPELEKGNIHSQHCSSCFNLKCDSSSFSCSMTNCKYGCGARYHACKTSEHLIICPIGQVEDEYNKMYQGVSGEQRRCSNANQNPTSWWSDKYFSDSFRKAEEKKKDTKDSNLNTIHVRHFKTIGDLFIGPNEENDSEISKNQRNRVPYPPIFEHLERNQLNQNVQLSLRFSNEPKHSLKPILMYSFTCSQFFRRDQIQWHWKNIHDDIFGGLDDWVEHRCPLASYDCGYSVRRLHPITKESPEANDNHMNPIIIYSPLLEGFGLSYGSWEKTNGGTENMEIQRPRKTVISSLPCEILYHIFSHLDSFRYDKLKVQFSI